MTYDPKKKNYKDWNDNERAYAEASAASDAARLLDKMGYSDSYRALVVREMSKLAQQKLQNGKVQTQGPSQAFDEYMSGGADHSHLPRRDFNGGEQ